MRRKERIGPFLERLKAVWELVPDWRFGQLMCNTLGSCGMDPFFVEDDMLISAIEKCMNVENVNRPGEVVDNHIEKVLREIDEIGVGEN